MSAAGPVDTAGGAGGAPLTEAVTALFVPGDRPERFATAAASGAGVIIIDLEDAVAPEARERALDATASALAAADGVRALVRIETSDAERQLDRLRALDRDRLLGVVVPKAESADALRAIAERLGGDVPVIPLVETARGVAVVDELVAVPGVVRLALGAVDLALDLDSTAEAVIDHARVRLVIASRIAGLAAPLDSPVTALRDPAPIAEAASRARSFGFGGMLCIHPAQVPVVTAAFRPTADELAWAREVADAPDGASAVDGRMIDRPVLERARRILARAGER